MDPALTASPSGELDRWGDDTSNLRHSRRGPGRGRRLLQFVLLVGGLSLLAWGGYEVVTTINSLRGQHLSPDELLAGDTEATGFLAMAWPEGLPDRQAEALGEIIRAAGKETRLLIVAETSNQVTSLRQRLQRQQLETSQLGFLVHPLDRVWIRDFGPQFIKTRDGRYELAEFRYGMLAASSGLVDSWARQFRFGTRVVPLNLEGGNLLTNGAGLGVTTTRIVSRNSNTAANIAAVLRQQLGLQRVVFLKPLAGERTGHADMFATFTAPDTIVVGRFDPAVDPVNAKILDDNAAQLDGLPTACGPLKLFRIEMPRPTPAGWATYTNVVYVNRRVLVPSYQHVDRVTESKAHDVYRRLLPGWTVVPVESTPLMEMGGSLHCATLNVHVPPEELPSVAP